MDLLGVCYDSDADDSEEEEKSNPAPEVKPAAPAPAPAKFVLPSARDLLSGGPTNAGSVLGKASHQMVGSKLPQDASAKRRKMQSGGPAAILKASVAAPNGLMMPSQLGRRPNRVTEDIGAWNSQKTMKSQRSKECNQADTSTMDTTSKC